MARGVKKETVVSGNEKKYTMAVMNAVRGNSEPTHSPAEWVFCFRKQNNFCLRGRN